MYGWDTLVLLRHLLEQGLSKTAIAARLGVSRRVLYDWIAAGELDRLVGPAGADAAPAPRRYAPRPRRGATPRAAPSSTRSPR